MTLFSKGFYLNFLVCPYCQGQLILREKELICRFHKIGFPIDGMSVNFSKISAKTYTIEEISMLNSHR